MQDSLSISIVVVLLVGSGGWVWLARKRAAAGNGNTSVSPRARWVVVGLLLALAGTAFWLVRGGAQKAVSPSGGPGGPGGGAGAEVEAAHGAGASLAPEEAAVLDDLRSKVAATPADLGLRKELALRLVENDLLVEAHEQAQAILSAGPNDPDGLYVEAVVRLAMGQGSKAVELADRVLAQHSDHVPALLVRGKAQAGLGRIAEAIATCETGLKAVGGKNAELEKLLGELKSQSEPPPAAAAQAAEVAASPPSSDVARVLALLAASNERSMPGTVSGRGAGGGAEGGFHIRVDLLPGATVPQGSTLFVALRGAAGGPPSAVKRVLSAKFPLEITLGPGDSMMGGPLPPSGTLTVRTDTDGNASTVDPGSLSASAAASSGSTTDLVLKGLAG